MSGPASKSPTAAQADPYGGAVRRGIASDALVGVLLFAGAVFLVKSQLYLGLMGHDADQMLASQSWALGYDVRNPPLYTWLLIALQSVFGVSLASIAALKAATIFGLSALLYLCARRLFTQQVLVALATLAPFAMYEVGWWMPDRYSHSGLLAVACPAALLALLRLRERPSLVRYGVFGLVIGLGLLSKYNFAIFLAALAVAGLIDPAFRPVWRSPRLLLTGAVAVLVVLPHGLWAIDHLADATAAAADRMAMETPKWWARPAGLASLAIAAARLVAPLGLLLPVLAWRQWRGAAMAAEAPGLRMLGWQLVLVLAAMAAMVLVTGATKIRAHYLFILILFPLWLCAWMQAQAVPERWLRWLVIGCTAAMVLVAAGLPARYYVDALSGRYGVHNVPYAAVARGIRQTGFVDGTIYADDYPYALSGNLRPYFPRARIVGSATTIYPAPARATSGQCLLVRADHERSISDRNLVEAAKERLGVPGVDDSRLTHIRVPLAHRDDSLDIALRFYPHGAGDCH